MSCTEDAYGKIQSQEIKWGNIKEQYQVTITNIFAALEDLQQNEYINTAWDNMKVSKTV
jgi:hypothetical protein